MWLARRLGLAMLTLWLVSILVFLATARSGRPGPRDPRPRLQLQPRPRGRAGGACWAPTSRWSQQYFDWLGGLLTGDLGTSLATGQPVSELISGSVLNSAVLVLLSAAVMIPLAFGVAMISVHYRRRRPDTVIQTILLAMAGLPEFVIGVLLIALFATTVFTSSRRSRSARPCGHPWDDPKGMVLPTLTLVLWVAPYVSRIVRASLLEVIDSDYVELARLKGIPEKVVMRKHALLNAIVPGIQVIALQLAFLAGGVVVVETLFSYPGIGLQLVDAVRNHDVAMVQALSMIIASVYVVVNLIADLLSILLTPRARTAISS